MLLGEELGGSGGSGGEVLSKNLQNWMKIVTTAPKKPPKIGFKDQNSGCILTKKTFYPL